PGARALVQAAAARAGRTAAAPGRGRQRAGAAHPAALAGDPADRDRPDGRHGHAHPRPVRRLPRQPRHRERRAVGAVPRAGGGARPARTPDAAGPHRGGAGAGGGGDEPACRLRLAPAPPRLPGLPHPRRSAVPGRDPAHRAVPRRAGGAGHRPPRRPGGGPDLRGADRPRPALPRVALPARPDGAAGHRHQERQRRLVRHRPPSGHAGRAVLARPGGGAEPVVTDLAARLAPHYSRFDVARRLLLTGHSHQAWPDVALAGQIEAFDDAALEADAKWGRAMAKADEVRAGFRRFLGDPAAELALGGNTHELVLRFLSALDLPARPRPVTSDGESATRRRQLARLAEEAFEVVPVPAEPAETLSERLALAVDDRTAAVLVSAVLFETARIVPGLGDLARACERRGAQLLVDSYHAL